MLSAAVADTLMLTALLDSLVCSVFIEFIVFFELLNVFGSNVCHLASYQPNEPNKLNKQECPGINMWQDSKQ